MLTNYNNSKRIDYQAIIKKIDQLSSGNIIKLTTTNDLSFKSFCLCIWYMLNFAFRQNGQKDLLSYQMDLPVPHNTKRKQKGNNKSKQIMNTSCDS